MKTWMQIATTGAILGGLLLAIPAVGLADKGGKPNEKSVAVTAACITPENTALVCSCKGLSNVVLQCGDVYVKHDDIGLDPVTGVESEVFEAEFGCVDSDGEPVDGPISLVAVKSGSQKNAKPKHRPDDYEPVDDAPPGSGLFFGPAACTAEFACPAEGDCTVADEEPPPVLN